MTDGRDGRIVTFYSYKGGTGRTMALANTAWILAANGKRVLVVDWDLEAPGLHRFFHPFLIPGMLDATTGVIDMITDYAWAATEQQQTSGSWHLPYARIRPHAVSLNWEFPAGGTLDFVQAGQRRREYSTLVGTFDWDNFYERLGGGLFLDAVRQDMKRHYDYVLLDSRTGLSDTADICTVHLPDVLVDCFTLSDQSMEGAAAVAREISERYGDRGIRILPVPMRIDDGEKERADVGRALARLKFEGHPKGLTASGLTSYWASVEIPYHPYYAYEEILATFGDQPGLANSLLSAFERLTAVISDGEVTALPPIEESSRLRMRDRFVRRRPVQPGHLWLAHVPVDRMWADWTESLLIGAGFPVLSCPAGAAPPDGYGDRTLVLLSPGYVRSPSGRAQWEALNTPEHTGARRPLVPIRIVDGPLPVPLPGSEPVDLVRLDEGVAAAVLLRALDGPDLPGPGAVPGCRFPGTVPVVQNAPVRNLFFTGRYMIMERLRDRLVGMTTPLVVRGPAAVGKSQIALEYMHRFLADYDLVWWVPAGEAEQVAASLAELADRIEVRTASDTASAARQALDALNRGMPYARWLLVYDDAGDPTRQLMPYSSEAGHVLVTSRNPAWARLATGLDVDVFCREESVEHLLCRVRDLTPEDAHRVADAVGNLPQAVDQAGIWLNKTGLPVDAYLELLSD